MFHFILYAVGLPVGALYLVSISIWCIGTARGHHGPVVHASKAIYDFVLPFMAPIYLALFIENCVEDNLILAFVDLAIAVSLYFEWKRNRNDRWKKLRNKIKTKVEARESGLVVVPA